MAYQQNPYQQVIPQLTNPVNQSQVIPQVPQTSSNQLPTVGVFWVQGLAGAQGFQVNAANTEVYLRDSNDNNILYIKTTDQFGRPNSLEKYHMTKEMIEDPSVSNAANFVTVEQLNNILDEKFDKLAKSFNKPQQNQGGKRNNGSKRQNRPRYEEDYDDAE